MNKTDKIREDQILIDNEHNYRPLVKPMIKETHSKVLRLIALRKDDVTKSYLQERCMETHSLRSVLLTLLAI